MRQTTLSVALEVQPESASRLSHLIDCLRREEERPLPGYAEKYGRLKANVPTLHFMSISMFSSANNDPLFVIEANFDGSPGVLWAQLEATLGPQLREMLRCCKKPLNKDGPLYLAVTAPGSRCPLAPYFEARALRPSAFHQGNRGLARDRILGEGELFRAIRIELAQPDPVKPNPYRAMSAEEIHAALRAAMTSAFPWLNESAPARISPVERAGDILRLLGFLFLALAVLSIPGIAVASIVPWPRFLILLVAVTALVCLFLYVVRAPL